MSYSIAIIGLDTSHAYCFPQLMQDKASKWQVPQLHAVTCYPFPTRFLDEKGIAERIPILEKLGVRIADSFEEAVEHCDAVFLEINDPALHLAYFRKASSLGKPVFLDKPLADSVANAREILRIARESHTRFFTASSLRFTAELDELLHCPMSVKSAVVWGPCGKAPAGSSIVWYGVHTVEMLERILGTGAEKVTAVSDSLGCTAAIDYRGGQRGIVQLNHSCWEYGAFVQNHQGDNRMMTVGDGVPLYYPLLKHILQFLEREEDPGVPPEESFEIMAILDAMEESLRTAKTVAVSPFLPPVC